MKQLFSSDRLVTGWILLLLRGEEEHVSHNRNDPYQPLIFNLTHTLTFKNLPLFSHLYHHTCTCKSMYVPTYICACARVSVPVCLVCNMIFQFFDYKYRLFHNPNFDHCL